MDRFVEAQESVYAQALEELREGRKRSHWMWFVFPQLRGLGRSGTAQFYGLTSLDEARAYLAHEVLGPRLRECTEAVLTHPELTAHAIFGSPDDLKFRSCMTLFDLVEPGGTFGQALAQFYSGPDELTLSLLSAI